VIKLFSEREEGVILQCTR